MRAQETGVKVAQLPLLWKLLHLAKSASGVPGGILSGLLGRRAAIISGWLIYGLASLGFGLATQPWHMWLRFGVYGLYFGLSEGVERALIADLVPPERWARAFGLYHFCLGVAALPSSLLMGYLYQRFGAAPAFTLGAILAAASALLLAILPRFRSSRT